eukprot:scaffold1060_cov40-Phaeocystis_antarctica.AAC.1
MSEEAEAEMSPGSSGDIRVEHLQQTAVTFSYDYLLPTAHYAYYSPTCYLLLTAGVAEWCHAHEELVGEHAHLVMKLELGAGG